MHQPYLTIESTVRRGFFTRCHFGTVFRRLLTSGRSSPSRNASESLKTWWIASASCGRFIGEFLVGWFIGWLQIPLAFIYIKILYTCIYHIYIYSTRFFWKTLGPTLNFFQGSNNSEIFSWTCHWRKNPAFVCKCSLDRSAFYPSWAMGVLEIFGNI